MISKKAIVGISMGDPSGIGPEIIAKALLQKSVHKLCVPFVIGDRFVMEKALALVDARKIKQIKNIKNVNNIQPAGEIIQVLDLNNVDRANFKYGVVDSKYGKAGGEYIEEAIRLSLRGDIHAVVTAPINKESFAAAGFPYAGHTEMFGDLTKTRRFALMLMVDKFRVIHVTMHVALEKAIQEVKESKVYEVIHVANKGLMNLGIKKPKIGVSGLNPHASDGGLFGSQEKNEILPAISRAKDDGLFVEGPFPADTIFPLLKGGKFDIVVAMYHDQGGIPMKLMAFDWSQKENRWKRVRGVNITLGLPIIRTSVAHGTGFEIAGKGLADPSSLREAIEAACLMAGHKFNL